MRIKQQLNEEACVVVPRREYERLVRFAAEAAMPPLPKPDERGLYPAIESSRVFTARDIIGQRLAFGLTRQELADLAHVRLSTIERAESGKDDVSLRTFLKIERGFERAERRRNRA